MRLSRPLAAALGIVAAIGVAAHAQNPPASPLDELRTALDREKLTTWVRDRVRTIASNGATAGQAVQELRTEYTGPDAFKTQYGQVALEQVRTELKTAKGPGAARLLTVVSGLADMPIADVSAAYVEALSNADAAVRAAASVGLRALRSKIANAAPTFATVVAALRDAGKKETSSGALKAEYLALEYGESGISVGDPRPVLDALVDILDARGAQYDGGKPKADGADHLGFHAALAFKNQIDDTAKKKLVVAAGRMMKYAVARYAGGDHPLHRVKDDGPSALVSARDSAELLIEEAEHLIRELLGATTGPSVANAMKKGKADEMRAEMDRWAEQIKQAAGVDIGALGG